MIQVVRTLGTLSGLLILAYAAICGVMYAFQERLLFFPRPNDPGLVNVLAPFAITVERGNTRLSGWLIAPALGAARPLIYYFGGNAEDVSLTALRASQRGDVNIVVVNYRGYGDSSGIPSEEALFADALTVFDETSHRIPHNGVVAAMGRSLGSGVAVHLAAERPIDVLVLVTPYDSIAQVAAGHYPLLPVNALLAHRFESIDRIEAARQPALFVVAQVDAVVPQARARALADAWRGEVKWRELDGTTHNTIDAHRAYWPLVVSFLGP